VNDAHVPSLSVIVFAYDEAEAIAGVLAELAEWLKLHEPDAELVFVDDGSRDGTLDAARAALHDARASFVRHPHNLGIGAALKSGVREARAPWVTFMPADGQIEPAAIGTLRRAAIDDDVDVVFSTYERRDDGAHRKVLSLGVRALIRLLHGVWLRSDGPYLFRRELFVPEELPSDTFFLNFEFPIRTLRRGLRTRNVVIACRPRHAGVSKSTGVKRIVGVARDLVVFRVRRAREERDGTRGA
jgi:dolichol-phosphate mannosyltransferase